MEITFCREGEHRYATSIIRGDGVELRVPSYDRTAILPHDIAHYVIETQLKLTRGFWGTVAGGGVFAGMTVTRGRRQPHASDRSRNLLKVNHEQIIEAEVLVSAFMTLLKERIPPRSARAKAVVDRRWRPQRPAARDLTIDDIDHMCKALQDLQSRWDSLQLGERFTVAWR